MVKFVYCLSCPDAYFHKLSKEKTPTPYPSYRPWEAGLWSKGGNHGLDGNPSGLGFRLLVGPFLPAISHPAILTVIK
jgi:hypothetical protein